ncbi:MAG: Na+/H+ antiporter NhaC [Bacteroidetes bacterium]|nr:Na+/H+ antiporter NhaC [Bacteroidota bacterium]
MEIKKPSLFQAFVPILFLILLLVFNVLFYSDNASYGPNQIALLLAAGAAALLCFKLGISWNDVLGGMLKSINTAMPSIIILLLIGALAGTWLISGIVPAMIYYGLKLLSPSVFLLAACVVCMIVSLATGSSWSTAATVGIALMGTGEALGLNPAVVAGAVISGAYFGDKMSPLSDTTNLAPAMAGTDLFTHIRYMTITTVPSIVITLIIFLIMGLTHSGSASTESINLVSNAIADKFNISPLLFIVPVLVIVLIAKKVPAIPALLVGTLLGAVAAIVFQPDLLFGVANLKSLLAGSETLLSMGWDKSFLSAAFVGNMNAMFGEIDIETGVSNVDKLLSNGGMFGMMNVIWLVITAMIFGGVMEKGGFLQRIVEAIVSGVKNTTQLISSTVGTCVFFNLTASEQYVAIVIPGKMFADVYEKQGLKPEVLSRTLEDSGTVTSVLVPWNSCGAYHAGVLKMDTLAYLPYCFFNLISPIMTITIAAIGYKIRKLKS